MTKPKSTYSSRTSTLLIATLFLASTTLSTFFIHQLPDDPLHLALHYGAYLHFANVMSIFGVIGAWKKNPLSIHLFSTYLLLDTLLSCIPRLLLLTLLAQSSSLFCVAPSPPRSHIAGFSDYLARGDEVSGWDSHQMKG
ncbi:hypothetical protein DID88_001463 [Monilinia fructigena]|uniref:Uncharacterized protein n=1 Tax=Monilinia fructigena TaxID=38457 RepID=A0A395IX60_9HELO|nr:hypothetical protein DID88_001463 [Monilinia fructigena]